MGVDKNRNSARLIAVSGVMGGLTILLGITHLGFIPFPWASLTIMQVPVIIAAILEGPIAGLIVGAIFGIFSLVQAAVGPTSPLDPLFVNPLISILPRLLIGPVTYMVYRALKGKENSGRIVLASLSASVAGSLCNTALVLLALKASDKVLDFWIGVTNQLRGFMGFAAVQTGNDISFLTWKLIGTVALTNGLPEALLSAILAAAVVLSWKKISLGKKKDYLGQDAS